MFYIFTRGEMIKMAQFPERKRIENLMIIGFGDRARRHTEVCNLCNNLHSDPNPIFRSTVSNTLTRYNLHVDFRNFSKSGRSKTATDKTTAKNVALE